MLTNIKWIQIACRRFFFVGVIAQSHHLFVGNMVLKNKEMRLPQHRIHCVILGIDCLTFCLTKVGTVSL